MMSRAKRHTLTIEYLRDVGACIAHPDGAFDVTDTAPVVISDAPRED